MNKIRISVGIAAYNEGKTIEQVLRGILRQKQTSWTLTEVLLFCDGCSDDTADKARRMQNGFITVIEEGARLGKTKRLDQMFRRFRGDILVMFDGDIQIRSDDVIERLIRQFLSDRRVMLVGGNSRPKNPTTFTQRAVFSTFQVFYRSRKELRGGNNIFGCTGSILAIRREFAKAVVFPPIVCEDAYLYLLCLKRNFRFRYADDAVIYYLLPKTLTDYVRQMFRSSPEGVNTELKRYFGSLVDREFYRPFSFYARVILGEFLKNPVGVTVMVCINLLGRPWYGMIWRNYQLGWFTAHTTHV